MNGNVILPFEKLNEEFTIHSKSKYLIKYLGISEKELNKVYMDYMLNEPSDLTLIKALIKNYQRQKDNPSPEPFEFKEWLVIILFFGLGLGLSEISELIDEGMAQTRSFFFSGKEKINQLR